MGGSAGGNLTTAVALKYTSHAKLKPSGLIIASPFTCDLRAYPEDYKKRYTPEEYTDSPILTREVMSWATGNPNTLSYLLLILSTDRILRTIWRPAHRPSWLLRTPPS